MSEVLRFEVRPLAGGFVAVGEEVTFKEEGGKLYALNEDGEAFGTVPAKFARQLEGLDRGFEAATATVVDRSDGIPVVAVEVAEEPAAEGTVAGAVTAAADEAAGDGAEPGVASEPELETVEPAPEFESEADSDRESEAEPATETEPETEPEPEPESEPAPEDERASEVEAEVASDAQSEPVEAEPEDGSETEPESEPVPAEEPLAATQPLEPVQDEEVATVHATGSDETEPASSDDESAPTDWNYAQRSDEGQDVQDAQDVGSSPKKKPPVKKIVIGAVVAVVAIVAIVLLWPCDHEWAEATCTEPATCTKCGKTDGEALGHEWQEATCTEPETCSRCGETQGEALGHEWQEATCTEPKTCSVCGETEGEALGHTVEEWTVDVEATCAEEGSEHGTCTVCGEEVTESIPLTDHTEGEWTVTEEATLLDDGTVVPGEKQLTCSVCGEVLETAEVTIDVYEAGGYRIGTDLPAGEYKLTCDGSIAAYYCVYTDTTKSDIIENENFDGCTYITVSDGQYLEVKRAFFVSIDDATPTTSLVGGSTYKVGFDIEPGEYLITAYTGKTGYYCIWSSSDVETKDIVDNDLFESSEYVNVSEGQYLELSRSFGS